MKVAYVKYLFFSPEYTDKEGKKFIAGRQEYPTMGLSGELTESMCEKKILVVRGVQMFRGTWLALTEVSQPQHEA